MNGRMERLTASSTLEGLALRRVAALVMIALLAALFASCSGGNVVTADGTPVGVYWRLTSLDGAPTLAVGERRVPYIRLRPDVGTFEGFGSCNSMSGSYRLDRNRIAFDRIGTTRVFCSDVSAQENAFLEALRSASAWHIADGQLHLIDASGTTRARFEIRHLAP